MALYWVTLLTLYSLFIARANDYLTLSKMVSTSSSLVMTIVVGAVISAPIAALLNYLIGNWACLGLIGTILFD